jgi:hypothetical protein
MLVAQLEACSAHLSLSVVSVSAVLPAVEVPAQRCKSNAVALAECASPPPPHCRPQVTYDGKHLRYRRASRPDELACKRFLPYVDHRNGFVYAR